MPSDLSSVVHWILFLPLGAAAFSALFLRRAGGFAAWFSTAAAFAIAGLSLWLLGQGADVRWHVELAKFGGVSLGFGYLLDANARLMLFVVSFVAAWIHLFSVGYMQEDEARGRFFGGLSIFMFSILGIVVADADIAAREAVAPGSEGLAAVVAAFGLALSLVTVRAGTPAARMACLVATLSMQSRLAAEEQPAKAMPRASISAWARPSSPQPPCSNTFASPVPPAGGSQGTGQDLALGGAVPVVLRGRVVEPVGVGS